MVKILILDIETAPKVALVWRFFKENISPKQVLEHGHLISFAAKWYNEPDIIYHENRTENEKEIISLLVDLLNEADIVITHNGKQFDLPQIRARAVVNRIKPPSSVRMIDTCIIARKEFGFPSNSLEYLSDVMGCKIKKSSHKKFPGFELWLECLRGNPDAWMELRYYNIQDVLVLEELYTNMIPWITNHPNVANQEENVEKILCPKCGSDHIQRRGYTYTNLHKYVRYQCQNCFGWARTRYSENKKNINLLTNEA